MRIRKTGKGGANIGDIVQVPNIDLDDVDRSYKVDNLRLATVNARSEAMEEFKIHALIVTETCLKDKKEDDQWTKSSELNTNGYQIQATNRINWR